MVYPIIRAGENISPLIFQQSADEVVDVMSGASVRKRDTAEPSSVLIIEDNPGDAFIMEEALREHGVNCTVTVLSDGEEASEFFNRIEHEGTVVPGIVLLDLNLPKRSGHWVLSRIRRTERCAMVPVIVVSSSEAESDLQANHTLGATAYFRKASNLDQFLKLGSVVQSLLRT